MIKEIRQLSLKSYQFGQQPDYDEDEYPLQGPIAIFDKRVIDDAFGALEYPQQQSIDKIMSQKPNQHGRAPQKSQLFPVL
jgi:hypothetical protein